MTKSQLVTQLAEAGLNLKRPDELPTTLTGTVVETVERSGPSSNEAVLGITPQ